MTIYLHKTVYVNAILQNDYVYFLAYTISDTITDNFLKYEF